MAKFHEQRVITPEEILLYIYGVRIWERRFGTKHCEKFDTVLIKITILRQYIIEIEIFSPTKGNNS